MGNTIRGTKNNIIGGLIGSNSDWLMDSSDESTVIAGEGTVAGGFVGINDDGQLSDVQTNRAVTTAGIGAGKYAENLGGIAGKNITMFLGGTIDNAVVRGVTGKAGSTKIVGGIVGTNNGMINYAYNESLVHGRENVGGIAGVNDSSDTGFGNIDYAANALEIIGDAGSKYVGGLVGSQKGYASIANARNTGVVQGKENVGGIVGSNAGKVTNAYNSTTVAGTTSVGSIGGQNSGTISKTYDSKAQDGQQLVGSGTDSSESFIYKAGTEDAKKKASYNGFDFTNTWKGYEGSNSPLLKVFLTKVTYDASKDGQNFVYNGNAQHRDIDKLITDKALSDVSGDEFGAYKNSNTLNGTSLINNDGKANKDAGRYTEALWSSQIGMSADSSQNYLGYDLPEFSYTIAPKQQPPDPIDPPQPPKPEYKPDDKNDYWYSTAPWDRERHFRERKAEFNYVDGGETIPAEER